MHQEWDIEQCGMVAFSDESSFTVKPTKGSKRVYKKVGERYRTVNLLPTFKSEFESISVLAAFSMKGQTALIRIDGDFNHKKCIKILEQQLIPFSINYHGSKNSLISQQDGCGPHRAGAISKYLKEKGIKLLPCPAQSPDMNPVKNAWAILKRNFRQYSTYPTSKNASFERLSQVWDKMPHSYFETLICSMPSRVKALQAA